MKPLDDTNILVADDERMVRTALSALLRHAGASVAEVSNGREALRRARIGRFDAIILDLSMDGLDGLDALARLRREMPSVPVVMLSGAAHASHVVSATRLGAFDFIEKPFESKTLVPLLQHALSMSRSSMDSDAPPTDLIGTSPGMIRLREQVERIGGYDVPVLVIGESGVGKELTARAIHAASSRRDGPFVAFNAAAVPTDLFESTVFGHVKGAFTGAERDNPGLMVRADGGTLVLDEIGDLSPANQVKLLRALESGDVMPVGATRPVRTDVRIVASTNADLDQMVGRGDFRADLYYRLKGFQVSIPPLRERRQDVMLLAHAFLNEARKRFDLDVQGFSEEAVQLLQRHSWPGNVRELRHAVFSAAMMAPLAWVSAAELPSALGQASGPMPMDMSLDAAERRHLLEVLEASNQNKVAAAKMLGVSRSTLYRMLAKHEIE